MSFLAVLPRHGQDYVDVEAERAAAARATRVVPVVS
jgi:hypothetical protein